VKRAPAPVPLRARFLALDDRLAKLGVPPLTSWWREHVGGWLDAYETGGALEFWACAGRGSAKSTAIYKLALFFAVFGDFAVPVGEKHYAIILSRLKEEAGKGVAIIDRWLELLAVPHHLAGDVIEFDAAPRGIRVVAASVAAASGWRAFFVAKDERSKWAASGIEERDGDEIDTSAAAMTATHERAPVVTVGSAWGDSGSFYDAIAAGTTGERAVAGPAPTWVAAPHVSEESTRRKERDPKRWAREYACQFQAGVSAALDSEAVEAASVAGVPPDYLKSTRVMLLDPSAGAADTFAFAVVGWAHAPEGGPPGHMLEFAHVDGIERAVARGITSDRVVDHIANVARAHGVSTIHADQFERFALASAFASRGIRYVSHAWTQPRKEAAVQRARAWLSDRCVAFRHERMKRELLAFEERLAPSGSLVFRGRSGGHDDYAMLLVLAAHVDMSPETGGLPGTPDLAFARRARAERIEQMLDVLNEARGDRTPEQILRRQQKLAAATRSASADMQPGSEARAQHDAEWDAKRKSPGRATVVEMVRPGRQPRRMGGGRRLW